MDDFKNLHYGNGLESRCVLFVLKSFAMISNIIGIPRLVQLCRSFEERNNSDAVLVASLVCIFGDSWIIAGRILIVFHGTLIKIVWHNQIMRIYLTHYQTTDFRLFQTKKVCRRQFQIWRKWQKVIQTGRKDCVKRNCSLQAISPFPTVFSKGLFPRGFKRCHCVGMG